MSWKEKSSGWQPSGAAMRDRPGWNRAVDAGAPRSGRDDPWLLLHALPALAFAARLAAGRERPDAAAAVLGRVEHDLAACGAEAGQAMRWLRILVEDLAASSQSARGWTQPVQSRLAAEAPGAGHWGPAALFRACLLLSPGAADPGPVSPLGPSLFEPAVEDQYAGLWLTGPEGAGKTSLLQGSGLPFRPVRGSGGSRWAAGRAWIRTAEAPGAQTADEAVLSLLSADGATGAAPEPHGSHAYAVISRIDRLDGHEALFGPLDEAKRAGPCGAVSGRDGGAAGAFARALAGQVLHRLAAERDPARRAAALSCAAALAAIVRQLGAGERTRPGWRGLFLTAAPPGEPALFVSGLVRTLLPGAAASADGGRVRSAALAGGAGLILAAVGAVIAYAAAESPPPAPAVPAAIPQAPASEPAAAADSAPSAAVAIPEPSPPPVAPGAFSFPGPPGEAYAKLVQPACRAATQDMFPFFGNSDADAPAGEVRRLFGPGGMLPAFIETRLRPLIATDGPVWRWRAGTAADAFDPATPELLAKLPALTALLGSGLDIGVEAVSFGGGVDGAALALAGRELRFDRPGAAGRARWTLPDQPVDSNLVLLKGGRQVRRYQEGGVWSPFRLVEKGRSAVQPDGATLVTFSDGTHSATFRLRVAAGGQPFGRGGLWSFRCPAAL